MWQMFVNLLVEKATKIEKLLILDSITIQCLVHLNAYRKDCDKLDVEIRSHALALLRRVGRGKATFKFDVMMA